MTATVFGVGRTFMMRMMMMPRIERKIGAADGAAIAIAVDDGARSLCSEGKNTPE